MNLENMISKKVDIPQSIRNTSGISRMEGSIVLKDVEATDKSLRIMGDLIYRGYLDECSLDGDCLWEGAEYFTEELDLASITDNSGDTFILDPAISRIDFRAIDDTSLELDFHVQWTNSVDYGLMDIDDNINISEELSSLDIMREEPMEDMSEDNVKLSDTIILDAISDSVPEAREDNLSEDKKSSVKEETVSVDTVKDTVVVAVSDEVREKNDQSANSKIDNITYSSTSTNGSSSEKFSMRYYRVQLGDDLNFIADRFNLSPGEIRSYNGIGEDVSAGSLLRIPG